MPTKTRTKRPATKPKRMPRKPRPANPSAEEIGCVIGRHAGYTLASCLEDLLSLRDNPGFDAVSASAADKLRAAATGGNIATTTEPERVSPVDEAIGRLRSAIDAAQMVTDSTADRLSHVLSPPPPKTSSEGINANPSGGSELAACLNGLADRIYHDTRARLDILNRLEL